MAQTPVYELKETRIEKLNDTNWRRWHETIQGVLEAKGVWEVIESVNNRAKPKSIDQYKL